MKKSRYIIAGITFIFISAMAITQYGMAGNSEPGSNTDPIVSKSYVDAKISEIKALIGNGNNNTNNNITPTNSNSTASTNNNVSQQKIVDEVLAVVEALYGDKLSSENTPVTSKDDAFMPVQVLKGQYLIGGEGAEIIFRSGKASAYSENEMGIIDVSSGTELFSGSNIIVNHLLIIARKDGRGVYATEDSWFMVKGDYNVK